MKSKRVRLLLCAALVAGSFAAMPAQAENGKCQTPEPKTDRGNAPPKLSFCATDGGEVHWQHDPNDSPNDDNLQDIEIVTTATGGYGRIDVMHVFGTPTAEYPNSSYEVKSSTAGPSLGSPRLVVQFSDGGRGELRPLTNTTEWQLVADPNWDNNGGICGFRFQTTWEEIQACHPGTFVVGVYLVADPYGHTHWIDNLNTAGRLWNEAADNGNRSAG